MVPPDVGLAVAEMVCMAAARVTVTVLEAYLHLADYPAYWENIRENVQTRIKAYFAGK